MKNRTLYIDCFSGIAGDMMLGALLDLGLPSTLLESELSKLPIEIPTLRIDRSKRHGIEGSNVHVEVSKESAHSHRTFRDIRGIIQNAGFDDLIASTALRMFERLARAEGAVHGIPYDTVHFHEVGAVDAIVDITGTAIGLHWLDVQRVVSAPIPTPRGFVDCEHGTMPLPAPGTLELLRGATTVETAGTGEYVTPTGAAILTTIVDHYGPIPSLIIESIGYGVGDRDPKDRPNLLRLVVGREAGQELTADLLLEANIDDMSPELYGHLSELVFKAGATDVWLTPIQMKKGRPGTTLSILCQKDLRTPLIDLVLRESTTLGLRILPIERYCTTRTVETLDTPMGTVRIKIARDGHRIVNRAPEYEDCKQLALESGLPLKIVYQRVQALLEQQETDG